MEIIQILIILFALFAFSRAVLRLKGGEIKTKEFFLWSIVWIAVIVVAAHPSTAMFVSSALGIGRAVDLLLYASIIILFYLMFRLYVKTEKMEQGITKLAREIAIKKAK